MKERPILFSAPMVRAILDGTKTQTRRVAPISELSIKRQGDGIVTWGVRFSKTVKGAFASYSGGKFTDEHARRIIASQFNPYGQPGDQLWVRETWIPDAPHDGTWASTQFYGCKHSPLSDIPERFHRPEHCIHRASWEGPPLVGWKPSIHMPRWASRISLEITGVRVERLQDISDHDAIEEGVDRTNTSIGGYAKERYRNLWDQINGAGAWDANPWVWVVEFKRLEAA